MIINNYAARTTDAMGYIDQWPNRVPIDGARGYLKKNNKVRVNFTAAALYYYNFEEITKKFSKKKTVLYIIIVGIGTHGFSENKIVQNCARIELNEKKPHMTMVIDFIRWILYVILRTEKEVQTSAFQQSVRIGTSKSASWPYF